MFSLIITIVSIALVAVIAIATLYYGGTQFNQGALKAELSKQMNEGQQIQAALQLYRANAGAFPTGTSDEIKQTLLSQEYLKSWPAGTWELHTDYAVRTDLTLEACQALNAKYGVSTVPSCSDPSISNQAVCCSTV